MRKGNSTPVNRKIPSDHLNREQKDLAYEMFFGPYKPEWKDSRGIIDNRDSEIARRIGVETGAISAYTEKIATEHFERIIKLNQKSK